MTKKHSKRARAAFAALFVVFAAIGIVALVNILSAQSEYAEARNEYEELRPYAPNAEPAPGQTQAQASEPPPDLLAINPDYIGWIRIEGTAVDYPVVLSANDDEYLRTTFSGEYNLSGAIFMDYRCTDAFGGFVSIVYGHNMRDGSMFSALGGYLESGFLEEHPEITVITPQGETLTYTVFAAVRTDSADTAYTMPGIEQAAVGAYMAALGAPQGAGQYIVLSTCTSGGNDTERLLVFAARV